MFCKVSLIINIFLVIYVQSSQSPYCSADNGCKASEDVQKYIFYDVNPPEGFNLRRDVFMRFAIMISEPQARGWRLVLPPWHRMYHWHEETKPSYWADFFDVESIKSFAPVVELHEVFSKVETDVLTIDKLYVLQNYEHPFDEDGNFQDKWEIHENNNCYYDGHFWGFTNVTVKETICVRFQGKITMLLELAALSPEDKKVMFANGEIALHQSYGTKSYWDCRKSMKFNKKLIDVATEFIRTNLDCNMTKCSTYLSVHWRRRDFARSRKNDVPSIIGTAKQIHDKVKKYIPTVQKIYVATDAPFQEYEQLDNELKKLGYKVYRYLPKISDIGKYKEGGVAIIDQIICSQAAYFIGTHESTYSFRIQEEREILGCKSDTTFNRLCPDKGTCEKPSVWTIV